MLGSAVGSPFSEYRVDDVFDQTAKAHEAHGGDSGGNQRDGQALEALRRVGVLYTGTHAAEQQHSHEEADTGTGGADQSLGKGKAEAVLSDNGGVVLHSQNGDAQHTAVGGDQRQVDAQPPAAGPAQGTPPAPQRPPAEAYAGG